MLFTRRGFLSERNAVLAPVITHHRHFRAVPCGSLLIQAAHARILPSLLDVFEEDPVVEAAALGALAGRY
jgi:hypothetical protein